MITLTVPATLHRSLEHHRTARPRATAVRTPDATWTYAELGDVVDALAAALHRVGVGPGDRVAHVARDSAHLSALLLAAARLGAVLVPVNRRLAHDEIRHILLDASPLVTLTDLDALPDGTGGRVVRVDDGFVEAFSAEGLAAGTVPEFAADEDTPIAQLYTSGTTGRPKGVVLAHRSFVAIARSLREAELDWIDVGPEDVCLSAIGGFHVGGLWFVAQALHAGGTVVHLPEFEPRAAVALIGETRATMAIVVPSMIRSILAVPGVGPADLASLRKVLYGGSPISDVLLERCLDVFDAALVQLYGLTETGNTAICLPPHAHVRGDARLAAAGLPYPGVEVKVVDDDAQPVPPGEVGEVWLRSPAAMVGYWNHPEATAATLVDGWVRTGDAGCIDRDGYLYLKDRLNDLIVVAGENVYPAEVERAIARHPEVADVAVVGIPDDVTGEAVAAYVQPLPGADVGSRDLVLFLRGQLAPFKLPRSFEQIERIPRNASGKVLRRELREPHWVGRDRRVN